MKNEILISEGKDKAIVFSNFVNEGDRLEYIQELQKNNIKHLLLNREELNHYSCFLHCLEIDVNNKLNINFTKAKEFWLEKYRIARTPLLASLDVDFMRAVESGDTAKQQEVAAKKQALRDVTKTELPDDLEGIKNTWPEILGEKLF